MELKEKQKANQVFSDSSYASYTQHKYSGAEYTHLDRAQVSATSYMPNLRRKRPFRNIAISLINSDGDIKNLEEIEREVITMALKLCHGKITEVSRTLGIGRSTLYRKIAYLGIQMGY